MEFKIRNESWIIQFVPAQSPELQKSDGSYTIGVTDQSNNTVYLADHLTGSMLDRVLCHELTHAVCMTYNLYMQIETEEKLCNFMSDHGKEIIYLLDDLLENILILRVA